jgi:hypothetical protein
VARSSGFLKSSILTFFASIAFILRQYTVTIYI